MHSQTRMKVNKRNMLPEILKKVISFKKTALSWKTVNKVIGRKASNKAKL